MTLGYLLRGVRVSQSRPSHKEWRNCDTADLCDSANEAAAGLALVINMNHGAGPLCLKGHLGKKKKKKRFIGRKAKIRKRRV